MTFTIQGVDDSGKQIKSAFSLPDAAGVVGKVLVSDGTNFISSDAPAGINYISLTSNVNLTTTGTTNLYDVPSGKELYVTNILIKLTTSGTVSSVGTVSFGDAGDVEKVVQDTLLTGLDSTSKIYSIPIYGLNELIDDSNFLMINVSTGFSSDATVEADVIVQGVLV